MIDQKVEGIRRLKEGYSYGFATKPASCPGIGASVQPETYEGTYLGTSNGRLLFKIMVPTEQNLNSTQLRGFYHSDIKILYGGCSSPLEDGG